MTSGGFTANFPNFLTRTMPYHQRIPTIFIDADIFFCKKLHGKLPIVASHHSTLTINNRLPMHIFLCKSDPQNENCLKQSIIYILDEYYVLHSYIYICTSYTSKNHPTHIQNVLNYN